MAQTNHLDLTYLDANQAQKHVTVNEALRALDAVVQLSVLSAAIAVPPASPAEGDRYIIAAPPTGAWAGRATQVAAWTDGSWLFCLPLTGWITWNQATAGLMIFSGGAWAAFASGGGGGPVFPDGTFGIENSADATRLAKFDASGIPTGTTATFALPNSSTALARLGTSQTFTGQKTFSNATDTFGSSAGASTANLGTGATTTGNTKAVNIATAGLSGSVSNIAIGSAISGALGTLTIHSPTVTFAGSVSAIAMAAANVSALYLGLGGAVADATNRFSINTPNLLFNHAGASVDATVNKSAGANDASFSFKTGFSTRALFGLLANDDFTLKVGPDGVSFFNALVADRSSGRVSFPVGLALAGLPADPASPADGWLWHNGTTGQLRARLGGVTRIIDGGPIAHVAPGTGDYVPTTLGTLGGVTTTIAGVADRMDIFPFIPRGDLVADRLSVNVTTLIAAALGKIVVYAADELGRPATLIAETATLDFSAVGIKEAVVSLTFRKGVTYWIGMRSSSTATLSAWTASATPDLTTANITVNPRKVLRRTLTFATGAPGTWGYLSSEAASATTALGTTIWLRSA